MNTVFICLIAAVAYLLIKEILKQMLLNRLSLYLVKGDYDSFDRLIDSRLSFLIFDLFNVRYMKMNKDIIRKDDEALKEDLRLFEKIPMTKKQKEAVYKQALLYYSGIEDRQMTKKYYDLAMQIDDPSFQKECSHFFNIFHEKGSAYLEEYLDLFSRAKGENRKQIARLIAVMYENAEEKEEAMKYQKIYEGETL